jgi:hypothetical protein
VKSTNCEARHCTDFSCLTLRWVRTPPSAPCFQTPSVCTLLFSGQFRVLKIDAKLYFSRKRNTKFYNFNIKVVWLLFTHTSTWWKSQAIVSHKSQVLIIFTREHFAARQKSKFVRLLIYFPSVHESKRHKFLPKVSFLYDVSVWSANSRYPTWTALIIQFLCIQFEL